MFDKEFVEIFVLKILMLDNYNSNHAELNTYRLVEELLRIRQNDKLYYNYKYESKINVLASQFTEKDKGIIANKGMHILVTKALKDLQNKCLVVFNEINEYYSIIKLENEYLQKGIDDLIYGFRPKRKPSLGERIIEKWLWGHEINYSFEYIFKDSEDTDINNKKFDYVIFYNDKLVCIIEYDGKQHDEPVKCFGGQKGFERTQLNDGIKNDYCNDKDYELIRIKDIHELYENNCKLCAELDNKVLPIINKYYRK